MKTIRDNEYFMNVFTKATDPRYLVANTTTWSGGITYPAPKLLRKEALETIIGIVDMILDNKEVKDSSIERFSDGIIIHLNCDDMYRGIKIKFYSTEITLSEMTCGYGKGNFETLQWATSVDAPVDARLWDEYTEASNKLTEAYRLYNDSEQPSTNEVSCLEKWFFRNGGEIRKAVLKSTCAGPKYMAAPLA